MIMNRECRCHDFKMSRSTLSHVWSTNVQFATSSCLIWAFHSTTCRRLVWTGPLLQSRAWRGHGHHGHSRKREDRVAFVDGRHLPCKGLMPELHCARKQRPRSDKPGQPRQPSKLDKPEKPNTPRNPDPITVQRFWSHCLKSVAPDQPHAPNQPSG